MLGFDRNLRDLRDLLADLCGEPDRSRALVECAGLRPAAIRFDTRADQNWYNILDEARKHPGKVRSLVECALVEFPDQSLLRQILEGNIVGTDLPWQGPGAAGIPEAILGHRSTLVPIRFLELGIRCARAVGLVRVQRDGDEILGSGFLVSRDLLITNWHVLPTAADALSATVCFNYQETAEGESAATDLRPLLPDSYFNCSEEDDWTVVRVGGNANATWGAIPLRRTKLAVNDRVNIIQHPRGGQKRLSLFHNLVTFVGRGRVQYLTDTEPGSSGSPVFDAEWRLVAIHHAGGVLDTTQTGAHYLRNEGIDVNVVLDHLGDILA